MTHRNACYLFLFGLVVSLVLFSGQLNAQKITGITITRNPDPKPCCEKEIEDIRTAIGGDILVNAKFPVIREFTAESERLIYAGSCRKDEDPKKGCTIYISERMYKSFAEAERYVVLAHEVCHFVEDSQNGTLGIKKTKEERTASEYTADKCSFGIIVKLGIDPRAFISALEKTKDAYRGDKVATKEAKERISRIKKEIKAIKKKEVNNRAVSSAVFFCLSRSTIAMLKQATRRLFVHLEETQHEGGVVELYITAGARGERHCRTSFLVLEFQCNAHS